MDDGKHVLYRFYATDDALLYIGITIDPSHRFKQHGSDKTWWHEVARIELETFENRSEVLEAEKLAIKAERPKYNIVHNKKSGQVKWNFIEETPEERVLRKCDELVTKWDEKLRQARKEKFEALQKHETLMRELGKYDSVYKVGQAGAFGLSTGDCPVGLITEVDDCFVNIVLKNWLVGAYVGHKIAIRKDQIIRVSWAEFDKHLDLHIDDHFEKFQRNWLVDHGKRDAEPGYEVCDYDEPPSRIDWKPYDQKKNFA
jgi:hypothetical protein